MSRSLLLLSLVLLVGCEAIEEGAEVLAGKRCASNPINTCNDNQVCVDGTCLPKCSTDIECPSNWCRGVTNPKGAHACYPEGY
jgi:hypothetical protein